MLLNHGYNSNDKKEKIRLVFKTLMDSMTKKAIFRVLTFERVLTCLSYFSVEQDCEAQALKQFAEGFLELCAE